MYDSTKRGELMRVGRVAVSAALAIAAALVSPSVGGAQSDAVRLVQDPRGRFTIAIPVAWRVRTSTGDPAVDATSRASAGELPDSLSVIVRDLPVSITPQACVRRAKLVMRLMGTNYKTVDERPDEIGGLHAYTHTYTWRTRTGVDRWSYQICAMLNRRAFVLIGTTTNIPERVPVRMSALARIMDTFRPKNVPGSAPETPGPEHGEPGNR